MYFHELMARCLRDEGAEVVFGVIGDANLYMIDSFERVCGGRLVSFSNESGGVLAAGGHARVTGGVGLATVTHGPALTNTVTALVELTKERTPVVLLAGDTAVVDRDNFQNIDQRSVVLPTGAGFEQVRSVETAQEDVAMAFRRARAERRPIVLNVPIELQWREAEHVPRRGSRNAQAMPADVADDDLDVALGVIASARRPIILAGRGAASPEARSALIRLAKRIGAPLATTLRGRDLFRGEPADLGICGTLSHPEALKTILDADCVIAFGASLNKWTTAEGSVLDGASVVQVDTDPEAIGRFSAVDAGIVGSAAPVAERMTRLLDDAEIPSTGYASPALVERLAARDLDDYTDVSGGGTVDIRTAIRRLDAAFPTERTLVADGGRFIFSVFDLLPVAHPWDYLHTVNFGSIGLGVGTAIGAATGSAKRTLLVCGDGGFMLGGLAELNTAVRAGVDLVIVVFNDSAYGAEHIQFRKKDLDPSISTFDWPDLAQVADALGATGHRVTSLEELDAALATVAEPRGTVLIEILIDPEQVPDTFH